MDPSRPFSVRIRSHSLFQVSIEVSASTSVWELKKKIEDTTGVAKEKQRLIYQGKVMRDEESMTQARVEEGFVIQLVERKTDGPEVRRDLPQTRHDPLLDLLSVLQRPPPRRSRRREVSWTQRLECIYQNLMTLEIVLAMRRDTPLVSDPLQAFDLTKRRFKVGLWVDVQDTVSQWLEAQLISQRGDQVLVHYLGWPQRWDEWLDRDSPRIQLFRSVTKQAVYAPMHSPYPVMTVDAFGSARAGLLDFSELLFEGGQLTERVGLMMQKYCDMKTAADRERLNVFTSPECIGDSLSSDSSPQFFSVVSDSSPVETLEGDCTDETPLALQLLMMGRQLGLILDRAGRLVADLGLLHSTRPDLSPGMESDLRAMPPPRDLTTPATDLRHFLSLLRPSH